MVQLYERRPQKRNALLLGLYRQLANQQLNTPLSERQWVAYVSDKDLDTSETAISLEIIKAFMIISLNGSAGRQKHSIVFILNRKCWYCYEAPIGEGKRATSGKGWRLAFFLTLLVSVW